MSTIIPSSSNTESWDSDPDLVLPDGPLTLIHSDTEPDPETSSSSLSAFFSNRGNQSVSSIGIDDQDSIEKSSPKQQQQHPPHHTDDIKGNTLTLKKNPLARNPPLHPSNFITPNQSSPSNQPLQDQFNLQSQPHQDHSFSSSSSSSECQQSTIKLSTLTNNSQSLLPSRPSTHIDHAVLAVLASGTQGSVTRLESSKKPSPIQAGFDWDQDIVLPEGGLRALLRSTQRPDPRVKKKSSFASAISDELEDLNLGTRSGLSVHTSRPISSQNQSILPCATVDEEGGDLDNDFELPSSSQALHLTDLNHHSRTLTNSKPNSVLSLDLDPTDNDPNDLPKSSTSSRRGSVLRTTAVPNSTCTSMSLSVANRSSIDDSNTQRIRTRPSLTPSLMSDRSSCSFPENEDDINEGFFDDIEFPPEFGIPNPLSAPSSSVDPPHSSGRTPKPTQSSPPDSKGKQSNKSKSVDLQSYLNSKIQARALMAERNNSSLSQQIRQNISTYEDRDDERVEDGLEIVNGSIHPANLRTRKTSSISSTSSLAPQPSNRNSYFQQPHGHRLHHPNSSTSSNISQLSKPNKASAQSNRSGMIYNHVDSRTNSPVPSSSTSTLSRRQSAPQTILLINKPHSVIPAPPSHSSRQPVSISHRPTSAAGVVPQTSKTLLNGPSFGLSISDLPRARTKSCRAIVSDGHTINKHPPTTTQSSYAPSGRVQSPLGPSSLGTNRTGSKAQQSSSLRARISTAAASGHGPPVLSASNQRTLKHKKSAAAIKSSGSGSSDLRSAYSSIHDNASSILSPPGSAASSSQRRLHRKQSMPSLNHSHHHSTGSEGLPPRLERAYQPSAGPSSFWKSNLLPKSRSKQKLLDYSSSPSSPTFLSSSALPSYADPTRSSLSRHVGGFGTVATPNGNLPDRSASVNSRRSSSESARMNATSPAPPPPLTINNVVSVGGSRLTMPTIASRLKAKPSIIHEEHVNNSNSKRLKASGITGVIPHQLRKPRRLGNYGDGTELDEFDDLPTSKEKEKMFTRVAVAATSKNNQVTIKGSNKSGSFNHLQPTGGLMNSFIDYPRKENNGNMNQVINQQRSKSRLETRKAEGARRRALAINNSYQIKKNSSKKGLIRQMSGNTLSKLSNNSEMRWNDVEARWEGNEHILREFDNALSTSSRPALISQLSIQSPLIRSQQHIHSNSPSEENKSEKRFSSSSFNHKVNKAQNHVVGGMIFDSESMSWKKVSGDDDEDNLHLESDEELELRWLADDESSKKHNSKLDNNNHHSNYHSSGNIGSSWNSFSSSVSLNQHNYEGNHKEEDLDFEDHAGTSRGFIAHNAQNKGEIISSGNSHGNGIGLGKRYKMIRMGSFWKACLEAEERHKKEIQSWIPVDHHSNTQHEVNGHTHVDSPTTISHSSKYGLGSHSYGRLTDSDRFYLQEIRKLVSEEEI